MTYENYPELKQKAKQVALGLMTDLKGGKLHKIGIEEIRYALRLERLAGEFDYNELEKWTTRYVVESV